MERIFLKIYRLKFGMSLRNYNFWLVLTVLFVAFSNLSVAADTSNIKLDAQTTEAATNAAENDASSSIIKRSAAKVEVAKESKNNSFISLWHKIQNKYRIWHDKAIYFSFWEKCQSRLRKWLNLVIKFLMIVGESIAIVAILYILTSRLFKRYLSPPILCIDTFNSDELDSQFSIGFVAVLLGSYNKLLQRSPKAPVGLKVKQSVKPQSDKAVTTILGKALPITWLQVFPALFRVIIPRRTYTVKGVLLRSEKRGAGITISLTGPKNITDSYTFWQTDYCGTKNPTFPGITKIDPGSYYQLADYAASWLLYRCKRNAFSLLDTTNWDAYSMFQAGLNAEKTINKEAAKNLYVKALRYDMGFDAARFNLALLADRAQYHLTLDALDRAVKGSGEDDPTFYHARYIYAMRLYETGNIEGAIKEARKLTGSIKNILDPSAMYIFLKLLEYCTFNKVKYDKLKNSLQCLKPLVNSPIIGTPIIYIHTNFFITRDVRDKYYLLKTYLKSLRPIVKSMLIGLRISGNNYDKKNKIENLMSGMDRLCKLSKKAATPRVHYNLACSYSIAAAFARTELEQPSKCFKNNNKYYKKTQVEALIKSLKSLETSILLNPDFVSDLEQDPSLEEVRNSLEVIDEKNKITAQEQYKEIVEVYNTDSHTSLANFFTQGW